MTPKQKRRLEQLALHARALSDYACTVDGSYVTALALEMDLRVLAAEGPPRCKTCGYHVVDACTKRKSPAWHSQTVVPGDYGCVLHSDYEASDA